MSLYANIYINPFFFPEGVSSPGFMRGLDLESLGRFRRACGFFGNAPKNLTGFADGCGIAQLIVQDESENQGLTSFKIHGALWAMAKILGASLDSSSTDFHEDLCKITRNSFPRIFVTATDGNHGAAVAFAAKYFHQQALVFLPNNTASDRINAIEKWGAKCLLTNLNYDAAVAAANEFAKKNGCVLLQDAAWPGYESIPALIMQGYVGMVADFINILQSSSPTHVFLQIGVGSFAAAMIEAIKYCMPKNLPHPLFIGLEPKNAACVQASLMSGDIQTLSGSLETVMAGLSCGRPSLLAWPILRRNLKACIACPDDLARLGTELLANPFHQDPEIIAGESGSIGAGVLAWLLKSREGRRFRKELGIDSKSRILIFNTEGATDMESRQTSLADGKKLRKLLFSRIEDS